jgi:hypothetical protein
MMTEDRLGRRVPPKYSYFTFTEHKHCLVVCVHSKLVIFVFIDESARHSGVLAAPREGATAE